MIQSILTVLKLLYHFVPFLSGETCDFHLQSCSEDVSDGSFMVRKHIPSIPDKLIVGYANWKQCDDAIITAVADGVNVVMWFSINLSAENNEQIIDGAIPDLDCVAQTVHTLRERGYTDVIHMISVGGWNSPLPDTEFSGQGWFDYFHKWNSEVVARAEIGWHGFDGIDWDPEGNNDVTLASNHFTVARMNLIGEMSVAAKRAGYLVSLAPAQSYLDASTSGFDLDVDHPPGYWQPDFRYHGLNTYAFWWAKYGNTLKSCGAITATFDWVGLQLYEGWSRANYELAHNGEDLTAYLTKLISAMRNGWEVDFENVPELETKTQVVRIPPSRLLIGLANGWTSSYTATSRESPETNDAEHTSIPKFLLLMPQQLERAYQALPEDLRPRGFMFWDIADEGNIVNQTTGERLFLAKGLNKFMHIRETDDS